MHAELSASSILNMQVICYIYFYLQVLARFQVAVAKEYFELEARASGKRNFEFPASGFVLMKEGRKETESGLEVGTATVTVGYNNKQTKKIEVGKAYILHKHSSHYRCALKLRTSCYGNYIRTRSIKTCEKKTRKNSRDSEKSRSDKCRETHNLEKKTEASNQEKTHRLGKKQK